MRAHDVAADQLAVEAVGLVKSYGTLRVLDGVDLGVAAGRVFALSAPTAPARPPPAHPATLIRADDGQARVAGFDVVADRRRVRRAISLTGQFAAVDELQTGQENLHMMGRLSHLPGPLARRDLRALRRVLALPGRRVRRQVQHHAQVRRLLHPQGPTWTNSTVLKGVVVEEVAKLRQSREGDIVVHGSAQLVQTLVEHDLIDECA